MREWLLLGYWGNFMRDHLLPGHVHNGFGLRPVRFRSVSKPLRCFNLPGMSSWILCDGRICDLHYMPSWILCREHVIKCVLVLCGGPNVERFRRISFIYLLHLLGGIVLNGRVFQLSAVWVWHSSGRFRSVRLRRLFRGNVPGFRFPGSMSDLPAWVSRCGERSN